MKSRVNWVWILKGPTKFQDGLMRKDLLKHILIKLFSTPRTEESLKRFQTEKPNNKQRRKSQTGGNVVDAISLSPSFQTDSRLSLLHTEPLARSPFISERKKQDIISEFRHIYLYHTFTTSEEYIWENLQTTKQEDQCRGRCREETMVNNKPWNIMKSKWILGYLGMLSINAK